MNNIDFLRSLIIQDLFDSEISKDNCDFKSWISSGKFIVRSISSISQIELEINDGYTFGRMLSFDSCRMASAAFETMESIQAVPQLPQSYGWIAIKCYYAAFFAAHSIMRFFGYTFSQLERGHVQLLIDYGSAIGLTSTIKADAGFFAGKYDNSQRSFELNKMGKTHEDTWYWLIKCLEQLSQKVLNVSGVTSKKQILSADLNDLINDLKDEGRLFKGNYLTQFRNAVNYRHEYHSWHPYGKNSIKAEKIISLISTWRNQELQYVSHWKESKKAYKFFCTCSKIVNLSYLLVKLMISNSTRQRNLYKNWPNKVLSITTN